ncbi:MAG: phage tail protein, partial [bacterium]
MAVTNSAFQTRRDVRISFDIRSLGGSSGLGPGLQSRIQSDGQAYSAVMSWSSGKPIMTLVRWTDQNTYTPLTSGQISVPIHWNQEFGLSVVGNRITGEVGGYPMISVVDCTIADPGLVGMLNYQGGTITRIDNFHAARVIGKVVPTSFSDSFDRSPASDLGSLWVNHGQQPVTGFALGFSVESNTAKSQAAANQSARAQAYRRSFAPVPDVTVTAKIPELCPDAIIGPVDYSGAGFGFQTRVQPDDSAYAALWWRTNASCETAHAVAIVRFTGPFSTIAIVGSTGTFVETGSLLGFSAEGTTLRALKSGIPILTTSDSNITSGGGSGVCGIKRFLNDKHTFDDVYISGQGNAFGSDSAPENTPANPVLVIRDLLLNTRYGLGLPLSKLDDTTFLESATVCDEFIAGSDGVPEKRFELDIVLDTQRPILDHLRDILATFRGFLVWSQGVVRMRIEKAEDVSQSFDMGNIAADSFSWKKQSYRDRPNVVRVEYINKNDEYRHDFVEVFDDWDIDLSGERRERIIRLLGIKRSTQAVRMAQFYLDQAIHVSNIAAFRVGIAALKAEVGDVVEVTHDVPRWTAKKFRIIQMNEAENDEISLTCLEYNASLYTDQGIATQNPYGTLIVNPLDLPWHVTRLTSHKRPNENVVEMSYTRANSADQFAGAMAFRRRGSGTFEELESTLALGPTAFLDSRVQTLVQNSAGVTVTSLFSDLFDRANEALQANSRWQDRIGSYSLVNCAVEFPLLTSSRCVSTVLSGGAALNARDTRQQLDVKFGVLPTSGSIIEHGLVSRLADASNFYAAIMGVQSGGADTKYLRLLKRIAGVDSSFVPPTSFGVQAGQTYAMRYEVRSYHHR